MLSNEEKHLVKTLEKKMELSSARINRLRSIEADGEGEFWKAQRAEIELAIKTHESYIEQILSVPALEGDAAIILANLRLHAGSIRAYKGALANVDLAAEKIQALNNEIASMSEKVKELQLGIKTPSRSKGGSVV